MRLADFILANTGPILREWDLFARRIWPEAKASPLLLRDHAEAILRAAVRDMKTVQSAPDQSEKSRGGGSDGTASAVLDTASKDHALGRVNSGFEMMELVAEYRALRASVVRLWTESAANPDSHDLVDLTRFNESIDQSVAEAVRHFTAHLDNSREMFLAILGHDLRNPLNAMMLTAELISESSAAETAALARQITDSGQAMSRMLADFLYFTSSRLGQRLPLARTTVNLAIVAREVMNESEAGAPQRTFRLDLDGNLVGEWDEARLRQLLSNLIGNAVQHGSDAAPVVVTIAAEGPQIALSVQNAGEPIPEGALPTIFDPLVQGPNPGPKPRRTGSMGLGLYIAREVVLAHGGTVEVSSSRAAGTTFKVLLPRSPA